MWASAVGKISSELLVELDGAVEIAAHLSGVGLLEQFMRAFAGSRLSFSRTRTERGHAISHCALYCACFDHSDGLVG